MVFRKPDMAELCRKLCVDDFLREVLLNCGLLGCLDVQRVHVLNHKMVFQILRGVSVSSEF